MATLRDFQIALQFKIEELNQRDELVHELEQEIADKDATIKNLQTELGKYRTLLSNSTGRHSKVMMALSCPGSPPILRQTSSGSPNSSPVQLRKRSSRDQLLPKTSFGSIGGPKQSFSYPDTTNVNSRKKLPESQNSVASSQESLDDSPLHRPLKTSVSGDATSRNSIRDKRNVVYGQPVSPLLSSPQILDHYHKNSK